MYTVKQLSDLAQVSARTLHYYDEIDLLKPSQVGENGYRYYDDAALLRLQQVLFYRELGLELMQIKDVLENPGFDMLAALRSHRTVLEERMKRLQALINTVDRTVMHLVGEVNMSDKKLFEGFSEEKQAEYERSARLQYDPVIVNESVRRWNSYSPAQKDAMREEGNQIYGGIAAAIEAGLPAQSQAVQDLLERWHNHLRYFYEPTLEILRGLGELYHTDPDFSATFKRIHADLPEYLAEGIAQYVDDLETAEITRLLAEDEAHQMKG